MKISFKIFVWTFCLAFFSCISNTQKTTGIDDSHFRQFLKKFKPLQLPLTMRLGELEYKSLPQFNAKSADTLFIKNKDGMDIFYGMLPDTTNYFALVVLPPGAADYYPVLKTFDKSGKLVSDERLIDRGCGVAPGLDYCSSTGVIKSDLSIYCVDTIKMGKVDSTYNEIEGTVEYYCSYIKGKINRDGKIILSAEKRKNLQGQ